MASTNLIAHIASGLFIIGIIYLWWVERQANELLKILFRPGQSIRIDDSALFLKRSLETVGIPVEFAAKGYDLKKIPVGLCAEWLRNLPSGAVTVMEDGILEVKLPRGFSSTDRLEQISNELSQILNLKIIYTLENE